ncbi:matrixin family metalloprotease [Pseudoalteromonas sp. APC 3224]|uniref:matrixin family metalloprotease n=1 Tax=Pseudoalteromonas sp. APC 3224 TaxID=3035203 RepID=UPI0025B5D21A|nr:matrixin family metalloprotease [Pseudoalteromonas sp. APC 3224]MDN3487184.1 matrixin family metalloprotease [Pseudoalteromonas sp. APC 3224]
MKTANWICRLLMLVTISVSAGSPSYILNESNQLVPQLWHKNNLPYKWHLNERGYSPLEFSVVEQELQRAFLAWQTLPDSNVTFEYQGITQQSGKGAGSQLSSYIDGVNVVSFVNNEYNFPESVLAICSTFIFNDEIMITENNFDLNGDGEGDIPVGLYPAGTIFNADIFFDGAKPFSPELLYYTALHEIGHCIGLQHSSIEHSVMYPAADNDIARGAIIKNDDSSTLASYMEAPQVEQRYGTIRGKVLNGVTGTTVSGTHVYAVNSETLEKEVGTYSLTGGEYRLFLPVGQYFLKIEPLDASHPGLEAERLVSVVNPPDNTFFDREYFDLDESSYETEAEEPKLFDVTAGADIADIDFYINEKVTSEFKFDLKKGLNYFGYPQNVPFGLTSHDLLQQLSAFIEVNRIERFNRDTGGFEFAFMLDGQPQGIQFDIQEGEGYLISSDTDGELIFPGATYCHEFELKKGLNLVGITCPPANLDSYQFIQAIGSSEIIESIRYYDPAKKQHLETRYQGDQVIGDKFAVQHGFAVEIRMLADNGIFKLSKVDVSAPVINYISPGTALPRDYVLISGQGFIADPDQNIVLIGGQRLVVQSASHDSLLVQIPSDMKAGEYLLTVSANELTSNSVPLAVKAREQEEKEDDINQLLSGMEVKGNISAFGEQDVYTFVALEGSKVNINVSPLNSQPGLSLQLLNPNGGLLIKRSASSSEGDINLQNYQIKETGIYTIVVSAVSVGAYKLSISIDAPLGAARTSALMGESQVAVKGTELKQAILLLVTDKRGQPVTNADVVLSQRVVESKPSSKDINILANALSTPSPKTMSSRIQNSPQVAAGDTYLKTLKSDNYGLIGASVAVPDLTRDFQIVVKVPSFPDIEPITLDVKVIDEPIAQIKIDKTEQNCGSKCPVGAELPEPWRATFLDEEGNGIKGVPVEWLVISGGGKLGAKSGETSQTRIKIESDASGKVEIFHKLGEKLYLNKDVSDLDETLVKSPQVVMMSVPGQSAPVVFTVDVKAGRVATVTPSRATDLQKTLLTRFINSLGLQVKDSFGNPVANAQVTVLSPTPDSGIEITPGYIDGAQLTGHQTNERGIWLGSISVGLIVPTIDEFGNKDTVGLAEAYSLNLQVGSQNISFKLDVDMGPILVPDRSMNSALIGQPLTKPFTFKPHGFMRNLKVDPSQVLGSDRVKLNNISIRRGYSGNVEDYGWKHYESAFVFYDINRSDFSEIRRILSKGDEIHFSVLGKQNMGVEIEAVDTLLSCEEVKYTNEIPYCSGVFQSRAYREREGAVNVNNVGHYSTRKPVVIKAVIPNFSHGVLVGSTTVAPKPPSSQPDLKPDILWWDVAKESYVKDLTGVAWVYPQPISLSFVIDDSFAGTNGSTSVYPGIKAVSGIDLDKLNITMPDGSVINGQNIQDSLRLNQAPNYARLWLEHHQISHLNDDVIASSPEHFQLIYEPNSSTLSDGVNTIKLGIADSAGNIATEVSCSFTYPTSIQCQE